MKIALCSLAQSLNGFFYAYAPIRDVIGIVGVANSGNGARAIVGGQQILQPRWLRVASHKIRNARGGLVASARLALNDFLFSDFDYRHGHRPLNSRKVISKLHCAVARSSAVPVPVTGSASSNATR